MATAGYECTGDTIISAIKPVLQFNRIFGLIQIVFVQDHAGKYRIQYSRRFKLYSYVVCLTCIVAFPLMKWYYGDYKESGMYWWYSRGRLCLFPLIPIKCVRRSSKIITLLNQIASLDVVVIRKMQWTILPLISHTVITIAVVTWNIHAHDSPTKGLLSTLLDWVPLTIITGVCFQFSLQVAALSIAITNLNNRLENFANQQRAGLTILSLRAAMQRHHKLQTVCTSLNDVYGLMLLLAIAMSFLESTALCTAFSGNYSTPDVIAALFWAVVENIPLVITMQICQTIENKVQKTHALCKEMMKRAHKSRQPFSEEMFEWKVQLNHQRMKFSACGLFYLNAKQILTVFSAIISYAAVFSQSSCK